MSSEMHNDWDFHLAATEAYVITVHVLNSSRVSFEQLNISVVKQFRSGYHIFVLDFHALQHHHRHLLCCRVACD